MAKEKKKREKTEISLPNISRSVQRRNDMAQGRSNYEGGIKAIGIVLIILLIAFILLGGINQRKFFETAINFGKTIQDKFANWVNQGDIEVNSDGIYIVPADSDGGILDYNDGSTTNNDTSSNNTSSDSTNDSNTEEVNSQ